mmetsp:Transcript_25094/g.70070  ORF Transcript_25094/g.70070 Transcript_25094/m.70070 type:complete len:256 (-) Transcript_25094:348-1115(-)
MLCCVSPAFSLCFLVLLCGTAPTAQMAQQKGRKRSSSVAVKDLSLPAYETSSACPCGSAISYEECCEPFIFGDAQPATCEELMRSRYSSYAKRETKYIVRTTHPAHYTLKGLSETELIQDVARTAKNCSFHKLAVLNHTEGATEDEGQVEFRAWFKFLQYKGRKAVQGEEWQTLTETSTFKKKDGRWMYVSGETDLTPMPYGDTSPLKSSTEAAALGQLSGLVDKAKELDQQAKAVFGLSSVKDGMPSVFGARKE